MIGLENPVNDHYAVDYVAHEVGHQLKALHAFRDCSGENDFVTIASVEPGSASTIMGCKLFAFISRTFC